MSLFKEEYRDNLFYNDRYNYLFTTNMNSFESKVEFINGNWYTLNPYYSKYKVTSIKSRIRSVQECLDYLDNWLIEFNKKYE
jgi:hypothetical protein